MKKKILFISPLPPPHYGSAMSSETCLEILKKSKDFEVRNIKLNYSKKLSDIGTLNLLKIIGFFKVIRQIKRELMDFNPDLIYFVPATSGFGLYRDYLFIKKIKKIFDRKILFHIRSRISSEDWKKHKKIYKKMFEKERALVLGKELVHDLRNLIPSEKVFILPNAIKNEVSDKKFQNIIKKREEEKEFNILFLSNMDESKGWLKLLQACSILKKKRKKFNCNFVGAWPSLKEKKRFEILTKKYGLEKNVKYLGKKIGKEKNKILENYDVLVFPTEYKLETFGRVILEGMMFGLPVIANGIATIPTTIQHGKTGFVLKENTAEEIAEKLNLLLNNKAKRINMGKGGRQRFLEHYTLKEYEKKFKNIFEKIK